MYTKNPLLCARVIAEEMSIETLISSSNEALASNEMKLKRRKVEEDAIKNVVLSADSVSKKNPPPEGITSDLASKIRIEGGASPSQPVQGDDGIGVSSSFSGEDFYHSPATPSSPSAASISEATKQILASIPPPPMRSESVSAPNDMLDSPPASPLLYSANNEARHAVRLPRSQHIMSKTGTDLFQISISKLKLTFTTKIAEEASCSYELDRFLPSILVEKGRLTVDDFNKFIYDKTKSGRWTVAHLKLSSMTGESNKSSYKKFYKEYEALGR